MPAVSICCCAKTPYTPWVRVLVTPASFRMSYANSEAFVTPWIDNSARTKAVAVLQTEHLMCCCTCLLFLLILTYYDFPVSVCTMCLLEHPFGRLHAVQRNIETHLIGIGSGVVGRLPVIVAMDRLVKRHEPAVDVLE